MKIGIRDLKSAQSALTRSLLLQCCIAIYQGGPDAHNVSDMEFNSAEFSLVYTTCTVWCQPRDAYLDS